ncbi:hypothetical protein CN575_13390 [Bacillus wiedmannii]|uniref:Lipoprotein n=1 Tax=Bacillus wiedmannii TaxID=1890302 RepID=A0A4U2MJW9_9BACI|nr:MULTISPECIES: hypothetical protein [Bacillus]PES79964.1 hypothetical protein CN509_10445 [Bacillus cereus]KAA0743419.1 hypothetical protein DN389_21880 [Bacillus sp. AY3-1]MBJ8110404.1 hypothetical protein [Bacillus cereus group sp. N6]MCP9282051.1 hypothetical protein [Bacillus wiedmannii]MED2882622.1 hypothetical protein [Bacillus wiedmannii]
MNKNISLLTLSLFLYLSACSTETNTGSTSTTEQPKVKTASIQQEENHKPIFFQGKEIKKIELISAKVKNKKAVINLEFDQIIKSMEHTGIDKDRERVIPLLLDDEAKANIDYQMNVNYQDGSNETYLIWLEDKKVVIARQDHEEQKNLEHYIIRDTDAQQILRLFKNNVE